MRQEGLQLNNLIKTRSFALNAIPLSAQLEPINKSFYTIP